MEKFIDKIISCSIVDVSIGEDINREALSAKLDKTNEEFVLKLYKDSNTITSRIQIYSFLHNATCFKYKVILTGKCQFDFPYPYNEETKVTELSSSNISRNNSWINPWNPALILLTQSNYDINFILSNIKVLALVCYITNDVTKGDCSQY